MAKMTKTGRQDRSRENGKEGSASRSLSKVDLESMVFLQDREIASVELDAFGHRDFALLLRSLIESATHVPPFSIGLLGPWGTGKSSIKEIYMSDLKNDLAKNDDGRRRNDHVHIVTFNAWRYGGENIKRALLRHTYLALDGKDATLRDALYHQIQHSFQHPKSLVDFRREVLDRWLLSAIYIIGISLLALAVSKGLQVVQPSAGVWTEIGGVALTAIGAWLALSSSDVRSLVVSRYEKALRIELPRTSAEEYEDLLLGQLDEFKKNHRHCRRLVIFVDDLDRLSAEEMVSGLDAVRTFMELPVDKLPRELGVVFVISCDEDRVAAALEARRRQGASELPAVILSRMDARRFLDRIFQFRIEIPRFPPQDLRAFAKQRLQQQMPDIAEDLQQPALGKVFDDVIDRMIHVSVQDPRNALQIVNAFAQSWRLGKARERAGVLKGRPGGLEAGAITNHPEVLAALSAIKVNFPDFYDDLQREPELIRYFTAFFLRQNTDTIPDRAVALLRKYQAAAKKIDDPTPLEVSPAYETLRQYMTSLQGMRWPVSLQPLLLLAQDPISRQFGDRARIVRDALISGDEQGVLAALGREHDARPLSSEDIQLLRDLQGDLLHDTEIPRNNAAAAMVALSDRLPADDARSLLAPVARRLVETPDLRWRVGVERIGHLFPLLSQEDQRDVAGSLVEDLLPQGGDVRFRTEGGELPSLDEARATVERAVPLIMEVWREVGLNANSRTQLVEWLQVRAIGVPSQGRVVLPHQQLEIWISQAEDQSLNALAGAYPQLVADALEDEKVPEFNVDVALQRSRRVFDQLWDTDRSGLWSLLTRFAELRQGAAAALAWNVMLEHSTAPDPAAITEFLVALTNRQIQDEKEGSWQEGYWDKGARAFLRLLEVRAPDVHDEVWTATVPLANHWSDQPATEDFAIALLNLIDRYSPGTAASVVDDWIESLVTNLSPKCINWLGMRFTDRLTKDQRSALVKQLGSALAKSDPTDRELAALGGFVGGLTDEGAKCSETQEFLVGALQQVDTWSQSTEEYVEQVFPVVAPLIPQASIEVVRTPLMELFKKVRSRAQLEVLGVLHDSMIGHWPIPHKDDRTYNPWLLFEQAESAVPQARSTNAGASMLRSMKDMVDREIVPSSEANRVAESACLLWRDQPQVALDVLLGVQVAPSPELLFELGQQTELESETGLLQIRQVWTYAAGLIDDAARLETAQLQLNDAARGTSEDPDLLFGSWIDAQGRNAKELLQQLARDDDLTDEQHARVWLQIERRIADLDNEALRSLLSDMLRPNIGERSLQRILEAKSKINERFGGSQERYDLARVLLQALIRTESADAQGELAQWLKDIEGKAVLPELENMEGLTSEHVELLASYFKNDKTLNRFKRELESE